jgi:hypothetical protein
MAVREEAASGWGVNDLESDAVIDADYEHDVAWLYIDIYWP